MYFSFARPQLGMALVYSLIITTSMITSFPKMKTLWKDEGVVARLLKLDDDDQHLCYIYYYSLGRVHIPIECVM